MRNAAAKAVWPRCETPRATSMAPVGVSLKVEAEFLSYVEWIIELKG